MVVCNPTPYTLLLQPGRRRAGLSDWLDLKMESNEDILESRKIRRHVTRRDDDIIYIPNNNPWKWETF